MTWLQYIYFFYISLLKSLSLVLIPGIKLDGHRGIWTAFILVVKKISASEDGVSPGTSNNLFLAKMS